jgi:hypothetical protein
LIGDPLTTEDESDIAIAAQISDVRKPGGPSGAGADYESQLSLRIPLRVTDENSPGGADASATAIDFPLSVTMTCSSSGEPGTQIGSDCTVSTTADAISPGMVTERKRAIWEVGQIQLYDGGPPSSDSRAGWKAFASQGLFVP